MYTIHTLLRGFVPLIHQLVNPKIHQIIGRCTMVRVQKFTITLLSPSMRHCYFLYRYLTLSHIVHDMVYPVESGTIETETMDNMTSDD